MSKEYEKPFIYFDDEPQKSKFEVELNVNVSRETFISEHTKIYVKNKIDEAQEDVNFLLKKHKDDQETHWKFIRNSKEQKNFIGDINLMAKLWNKGLCPICDGYDSEMHKYKYKRKIVLVCEECKLEHEEGSQEKFKKKDVKFAVDMYEGRFKYDKE